MTHFWNDHHQVHSSPKDWKAKYKKNVTLKSLEAIKPKGINRITKNGQA